MVLSMDPENPMVPWGVEIVEGKGWLRRALFANMAAIEYGWKFTR